MHVGYARVSTADQSTALQVDALKAAGCEKVFEEVAGGAKEDRTGLRQALEYLRAGDTLVVWRLDRLGRNLAGLIRMMTELRDRQIGFRSLVEVIDTTTPTGQFFFQIVGAFAELERNLIRERTRAGLEAARARGRRGGRPKAIDKATFRMAEKLYEDREVSVDDVCEKLGIKRRTFYYYLRQARETQAAE